MVTPLLTDVRAAFTAALALPPSADFSQTRFPRIGLPRFSALRSVDWSESDLVFASVSGADLRSAYGLTGAQLRTARTDKDTKLGELKKRSDNPICGPHALWGEVLHAPAL